MRAPPAFEVPHYGEPPALAPAQEEDEPHAEAAPEPAAALEPLTAPMEEDEPHAAAAGPTSVMYSSEDNGIIVIRNGVPIASGEAELKLFAAKPKGTYTYVADGWTRDDEGTPHPHWHQVAGPEGSAQIEAFGEIKIDGRLKHAIDMLVQPGTTLILTDETLKGKTRSEPGFSIMQGTPKVAAAE